MAADDTDRADEHEAERNDEIEDELERIDRDPDEADADGDLGKQRTPRREEREDDS